MSKELDLQTKIIKSARHDQGYGRKMSNKFSIGIPDLLLGIHPFAPCLVEVKDLGVVVPKFDRKLEVTDKQALEMQRLSEGYEFQQSPYTPNRRTACVMVGLQHNGSHRLVVLPRNAQRIDHSYEGTPGCWTERQTGGYYDLKKLLDYAGICKVNLL